MYLKYVNILCFIILTCLCWKIWAQNLGSKDCIISVPKYDKEMPIVYEPENDTIIYPNRQGDITLKLNRDVKMACVGSYFVSPFTDQNINEITVQCINRHLLRYSGSDYTFENFRCKMIPVPTMVLTNRTCQKGKNNRLINVGFQLNHKFRMLYRICYNIINKTPIYAWYNVNVPKYRFNQYSSKAPQFIETEMINLDEVDAAYANQRSTFRKILSSELLARWYIQYEATREFDGVRYLNKGFLLPPTDFVYTYEQHATYYNENTAPQWLIYQKGPGRDMESFFKRFVLRTNTRHLIVSGTFSISAPLNNTLEPNPIFLSLPDRIPVPEFFWRMEYDLKNQTGIVYVAYNTAWKAYESIRRACHVIRCPHRLRRRFFKKDLFYCCTISSFESSFGKFDPILYEQF